MGLDIYFYKTKNTSNDIAEVYSEDNNECKRKFSRSFHHYITQLKKCVNKEEYNKIYSRFLKKMKWYFPYDFQTKAISDEIKDTDSLEKWKNNCYVSMNEDMYYRKVNFLYKYFRDNSNTFNDESCWVTKDMANEIVENCDKVLKDKNHADEILPTCSGFFFGSTDYDEYYIEDVKNVRKQFKKLLKNWKDDERVYVIFSW